MILMAVDPGLSGAVAFMSDKGQIVHYQKMPVRHELDDQGEKTGKKTIDVAQIAAMIARFEPEHVFIEKVHAMPGQGVSSMFTFGMGYGMIRGLCMALEALMQTHLVTPQKWQKFMYADMLNAKELEPKKRAMAKFYDLWPEMMSRGVTHDGIIDALLLADYGRRTLSLN